MLKRTQKNILVAISLVCLALSGCDSLTLVRANHDDVVVFFPLEGYSQEEAVVAITKLLHDEFEISVSPQYSLFMEPRLHELTSSEEHDAQMLGTLEREKRKREPFVPQVELRLKKHRMDVSTSQARLGNDCYLYYDGAFQINSEGIVRVIFRMSEAHEYGKKSLFAQVPEPKEETRQINVYMANQFASYGEKVSAVVRRITSPEYSESVDSQNTGDEFRDLNEKFKRIRREDGKE